MMADSLVKCSSFQRVNFDMAPSFLHMTATNVAIQLWGQPDIADALTANLEKMLEKFPQIEKLVVMKLSELELPELIAKEVEYVNRHVGQELISWILMNRQLILDTSYPMHQFLDETRWTARGYIDQTTSANVLLDNQSLTDTLKFKVASNYCCEDQLSTLWCQMPVELQKIFLDSKEFPLNLWANLANNSWTKSFSAFLDGDDDVSESSNDVQFFYLRMFKHYISCNDHVFVEYFWRKLDAEKKLHILDSWADREFQKRTFDTKIVIFLLSQQKNDQQEYLLKEYAYFILKRLSSDWRWRDIFVVTVKHMQGFITGKTFLRVLCMSVFKIGDDFEEDEKYQLTFEQLWGNATVELKAYVFKRGWNLFLKLIRKQDRFSLKLILNDASAEQRKEIASCAAAKQAYCIFIEYGNLHLLNFFITTIFHTDDSVSKFKQELFGDSNSEDFPGSADILFKIVTAQSWHVAEEYLNWRFSTEEQMLMFKTSGLSEKKKMSVFSELLRNYKVDDAEQFRHWCSASVEDILCAFADEECRIMFKDRVPYFLLWGLVIDQQRSPENCNVGTVFNKIVSNFFNSELHVIQFQVESLVKFKYADEICNHLIDKNEQALATPFLNWLFNDTNKIRAFKNQMFAGETMLRRCVNYLQLVSSQENDQPLCGPSFPADPWAVLKDFLSWFEPSPKLVDDFMKELDEYIIRNKIDKEALNGNYDALLKLFINLKVDDNGTGNAGAMEIDSLGHRLSKSVLFLVSNQEYAFGSYVNYFSCADADSVTTETNSEGLSDRDFDDMDVFQDDYQFSDCDDYDEDYGDDDYGDHYPYYGDDYGYVYDQGFDYGY